MVLSVAEQRLAEALWGRYKRGADEVLAEIASLFEVTVEELRSGSRRAVLVDARAIVALILRNRSYSYPEIGELLGGRSHASIIHCLRRFERDPELRALAEGLAA